MRLRHATTRERAAKIATEGLRVSCADSSAKIKAVWMHSPSLSAWAVVHTLRKHKANLDDVVIIEIDVPRGWLRRFRKGFWYCKQDVPADRIRGYIDGAEFGASVSE